MKNLKTISTFAALALMASVTGAMAQETFTITMKNGAFDPAALVVPANQKIHLVVKNEEAVQTEFESYPLNQEQKIKSGESADMYIGPLDAGEYPIFDDNNEATKGKVVAK